MFLERSVSEYLSFLTASSVSAFPMLDSVGLVNISLFGLLGSASDATDGADDAAATTGFAGFELELLLSVFSSQKALSASGLSVRCCCCCC